MAVTVPLPLAAARERLIQMPDDNNGMERQRKEAQRLNEIASGRVLAMAQLRNELVAKGINPTRDLLNDKEKPVHSGWPLIEKVRLEEVENKFLRKHKTITNVAGLMVSNEAQLVEYRGSIPGDQTRRSENIFGSSTYVLESGPIETRYIGIISLAATPNDVDPELTYYTGVYKIEDAFAGMVVRHRLDAAEL